MPTGGCLRDHYEQAKKGGAGVPQLDTPPLPPIFLPAWIWFWELNARRQSSVGPTAVIPQPIPYTEIEAWARYTGRRPSYLERKAIDVFDRSYLEVMK